MISVIIPTLNESETIGILVSHLLKYTGKDLAEVIVSDAGSTDDTREKAVAAGAVVIHSPEKGRAAQMNFGASKAVSDTLYFVHADCFPPASFTKDIEQAIREGYGFGRFRTKFDSKKTILKINAFVTRFNLFICYGGDQTLFITKNLFEKINGFSGEMRIMEDYDIVVRAKQSGRYKIIQKDVLVSARKYLTNSWLTVQRANYRIVQMYKKGYSQTEMAEKYKQSLNYR